MIPFSLVIITKNEERNIEQCIRSVKGASEVLVVDSGSTDKTEEIVRGLGGKFLHNDWPGYGKQKQFALDTATHDWVLLLDADEYLEEKAQEEIVKLFQNEPHFDAYEIPRKQIFMQQVCEYGKSVDFPIRLTNKKRGQYDLKNIHESFICTGQVGRLKNGMLHNSGVTVIDRCRKMMRDFELEMLNNTDPNITAKRLIIEPVLYFLNYFIKRKAYKDGIAGFVMTGLFATQIFIQHAGQFEKKYKSGKKQ